MKIALAQINPTVGDFVGNSQKIFTFAETARDRGADLVVFSELSLCGYLPFDLIERPHFIEQNEKELKSLAKKLPIPAIVGYAARANESTRKTNSQRGRGTGKRRNRVRSAQNVAAHLRCF